MAYPPENVKPEKKYRGPLYLDRDLPESKALTDLPGIALHIYIILLSRRTWEKRKITGHKKKTEYVCTNDPELILSYRYVQKHFGYTQPRFRRAIDALVERGLIDIIESGRLAGHVPTKYGLSDRWRNYGTAKFEKKPRQKMGIGFCAKKRDKKPVEPGAIGKPDNPRGQECRVDPWESDGTLDAPAAEGKPKPKKRRVVYSQVVSARKTRANPHPGVNG